MVRSPSGCSEVSSIRSGVRGAGMSSGVHRGFGSFAIAGTSAHQSGQCYLGLALPLDLDNLLYDAIMDKKQSQQEAGVGLLTNGSSAKDRFPAITESEELEAVTEENASNRRCKYICFI